MKVFCFYGCGREVDPQSRYTYQRIVGWHRPGRAGGSDISAREKREQWACEACVDKVRRGINPMQASLL